MEGDRSAVGQGDKQSLYKQFFKSACEHVVPTKYLGLAGLLSASRTSENARPQPFARLPCLSPIVRTCFFGSGLVHHLRRRHGGTSYAYSPFLSCCVLYFPDSVSSPLICEIAHIPGNEYLLQHHWQNKSDVKKRQI